MRSDFSFTLLAKKCKEEIFILRGYKESLKE